MQWLERATGQRRCRGSVKQEMENGSRGREKAENENLFTAKSFKDHYFHHKARCDRLDAY